MYRSLGEAAKACNVSKSTILRSIKAGRITATRSERTNDWEIDPAELLPVLPVALPLARRAAGVPQSTAPADLPWLQQPFWTNWNRRVA